VLHFFSRISLSVPAKSLGELFSSALDLCPTDSQLGRVF